MNQTLEPRRLGWLARKDFFAIWRGTAIAAGAVAGSIFIIAVLGALIERQRVADYSAAFQFALVVWGAIAASLAFGELHDKTRNEDFLLLPASSLEKVLVRLIRVSVVLPVFILIVVFLASILSEATTSLFFSIPFRPFNPLAGDNWTLMGCIIIMQSVFFLGAAWFKKAHLLKTGLSLMIFGIALGFVAAFVFRLLFAAYFEGFFTPVAMNIDFEVLMHQRFPALMDTLEVIGKTVFYGLLAPFCWFVAWLRVKETQSSDGI